MIIIQKQKKTRKSALYGNIVIEANLDGKPYKVIGFENHGGKTYNVSNSFGKVLTGTGNNLEGKEEGFSLKNVIATYLHGPLLSKNPELADFIINYCLKRKYNEEITLEPLDDTLENLCRNQLLEQFLKEEK